MSVDSHTQTMETYRRMAREARYRPAAPSDGLGNITVPYDELDLETEARDYAMGWRRDEDDGTYNIGCPDFEQRPALVFAVEGARMICGSTDQASRAAAATLLRMAADELDPGDG